MASEYYLGDDTSRFIIHSNSRITDGWSVIANCESRFEANNGPGTNLVPNANVTGLTTGAYYGGWAEGETWGGVSSPYGTLTFGKNTVYYFDTIALDAIGVDGCGESYRILDSNGLATLNILDGVQQYSSNTHSVGGAGTALGSKITLGNTRSQNVVKYSSPLIADSFTFALYYSKNPYGSELQYSTPGTTPVSYENGGMLDGKFVYSKGPVYASLSLLSVRPQGGATAGAGNTQAYRAGASYKDPSGWKVGFVFDHTAVSNSIITSTNANGSTASRNAFLIPVSYSFGDHTVHATYTHAMSTCGIANSAATQYNLVYDYSMTKRAFIGLFCCEIINGTASDYAPYLGNTNLGPTSPNQGENWRQVGLHLMYWF
jgi:predicted porin